MHMGNQANPDVFENTNDCYCIGTEIGPREALVECIPLPRYLVRGELVALKLFPSNVNLCHSTLNACPPVLSN